MTPHLLRYIRANFPVEPAPSVPEIRVHKAGPRSGLWRLAEMDEDFGAPYWAHYWGGGLALARHLLDYPVLVAGRRVLDLGAGSGIVGIAAAKSGAKQVIAADIDPYAIAAIGLNTMENGVALSTFLGDATADMPPDVDVVLVGDLFYAEDLTERVTAFLDRCLASEMNILIGDPWRAHLPRNRVALLAEYPGADFGRALSRNAVFAFRAA